MGKKAALSARMQAVADMVSKGSRVCDVGCDHGYISIYLVQNGISPFVLAMDVNKGPLARAEKHIFQAGLDNFIMLRLSDGLLSYEKGEAETLICAGMGGRLMRRILEREPHKTRDFKELILQPQSDIPDFRRFLRNQGYSIVCENMILEEGKFYPVIKAVPVLESGIEYLIPAKEQAFFDRFGPVLLKEKHPALGKYIIKEWENNCRIKHSLAGSADGERAVLRKRKLEEEMAALRKAAEVLGIASVILEEINDNDYD